MSFQKTVILTVKKIIQCQYDLYQRYITTAKLFNEAGVQKSELKWLDYFLTRYTSLKKYKNRLDHTAHKSKILFWEY